MYEGERERKRKITRECVQKGRKKRKKDEDKKEQHEAKHEFFNYSKSINSFQRTCQLKNRLKGDHFITTASLKSEKVLQESYLYDTRFKILNACSKRVL